MAAPTVNVLCKLFAAFLLFYLTFVKQAFSQKFLPENTHYEEVKILVGTKSSVLLFLYDAKEGCSTGKCAELQSRVLTRLIKSQYDGDENLFGAAATVHVVKTSDAFLPKDLGLTSLPQLVYFRNGEPLLYTGRADILELVLWLEGNSVDARSGFAHALDDSNFEHLTQASSGATTGDWFVLFYSGRHVQPFDAVWNAVHSKFYNRINVAKVDVDENPQLKERFSVNAYPTIIFLRQGSMYHFPPTGPELDFNALAAFLDGSYKSATPSSVPKIPSAFDKAVEFALVALEEFAGTPAGFAAQLFAAACLLLLSLWLLRKCCRRVFGKKRRKQKKE